MFGNARTHDRLVRELAVGADAAVVFPEYGLSPEARYPVAVEQNWAVARWIVTEGAGADLAGTLSGALGLLLAAVAMYAAFALMLEDMRGREVLPIGRSGPAHTAVEGDLTVRLRDLERQAGVRRTL